MLAALLFFVLGFLLFGVGTTTTGTAPAVAPPPLERTLPPLRTAPGPPLYWVGTWFEGLPLTVAGRVFVYGACVPKESGGCAPPALQIQNFRLARRHPAMLDRRFPCSRTTVRGVPAASFASSGGALEVYARRTVVVIDGFGRRHHLRVARALRPVNRPPARTRSLPAPPASVRRALARCAPTR